MTQFKGELFLVFSELFNVLAGFVYVVMALGEGSLDVVDLMGSMQ
jgi:hypothetical protein